MSWPRTLHVAPQGLCSQTLPHTPCPGRHLQTLWELRVPHPSAVQRQDVSTSLPATATYTFLLATSIQAGPRRNTASFFIHIPFFLRLCRDTAVRGKLPSSQPLLRCAVNCPLPSHLKRSDTCMHHHNHGDQHPRTPKVPRTLRRTPPPPRPPQRSTQRKPHGALWPGCVPSSSPPSPRDSLWHRAAPPCRNRPTYPFTCRGTVRVPPVFSHLR